MALPAVLVVAGAVGAGGYALSGGFSTPKPSATAGTLGTTSTTRTPAGQAPTSSSPTTSPATTSTTTATSTTATSTTSTSTTSTSTTLPATTTTTIPSLSATSVSVEVLNGDGVPGAAGGVSSELSRVGFDVVGTTDAANFGYTTSVIEYAPGELSAAQTVARYLDGPVEYEASSNESGDSVTLIIGSSLSSVRT